MLWELRDVWEASASASAEEDSFFLELSELCGAELSAPNREASLFLELWEAEASAVAVEASFFLEVSEL